MAKASKLKEVKEDETPEIHETIQAVEVKSDEPATSIEDHEEVASVPETIIEISPFSKEPLTMVEVATNKIFIPPTPTYRKELDKNLSFEERIVGFLQSRGTGQSVKLNDFLKSLFKLPDLNAPPEWASQGASKRLRSILDKMQSAGTLTIINNQHRKLGMGYYAGEQKILQHYNLNNVTIEAVM